MHTLIRYPSNWQLIVLSASFNSPLYTFLARTPRPSRSSKRPKRRVWLEKPSCGSWPNPWSDRITTRPKSFQSVERSKKGHAWGDRKTRDLDFLFLRNVGCPLQDWLWRDDRTNRAGDGDSGQRVARNRWGISWNGIMENGKVGSEFCKVGVINYFSRLETFVKFLGKLKTFLSL